MNLLDLFVKISVDDGDVDKGFSETSSKAETLAGKLKSGLATAAKVGAAAVTAAATGVAALAKASIDQYAEYEQLVGGVDTLFKTASDKVQEYAANAYKTAGMSANEYMDTVTSFSASLLQSLGGDTDKAAQKADQAITDMADNANKMGTSMEMIQNAYQGFAKQNYTMLDNLKLGYGGTKEEMERLLADAEKLSGQKFDISSYSDIVDAIHVVQTEMGITGTTAKEAATTIQGSVSAAKSAWSNLITGIADDNADLDQLIGNFVGSVETAAGNIIPRVTQILSGMGAAIQQIAPILAEEVPALISSTLPALVSAGAQLLVGLITGLVSALPELVAAVPQIVTEVYNSFVAAGPQLLEAGSQLLGMLANGVIQGIPAMIERLPEVIVGILNFISNNLPRIASAGAEILMKLAMGIISTIPSLVAQLPQIINAIVHGIAAGMESVVNIGKEIVKGLWKGIQNMAGWIKSKVTGFISGIVNGVKSVLGIHSPSRVFAGIGENMALGLGKGWDDEYDGIKRGITDGLDFGTAQIGMEHSVSGKLQGALSSIGGMGGDIHIVVQSVLDGKVIGETAYKYNRQMQRAMGV